MLCGACGDGDDAGVAVDGKIAETVPVAAESGR